MRGEVSVKYTHSFLGNLLVKEMWELIDILISYDQKSNKLFSTETWHIRIATVAAKCWHSHKLWPKIKQTVLYWNMAYTNCSSSSKMLSIDKIIQHCQYLSAGEVRQLCLEWPNCLKPSFTTLLSKTLGSFLTLTGSQSKEDQQIN